MHLAGVPLVLLLLAANPAATDTPSAPAKSGSARVEVPAFGVSYEKPAGWFALSVNLYENLKRTGLTEEEQRAILANSPGSVTLHSFQKYDATTTAGFIPTINVIALPNNMQTSEELLAVVKAHWERSRSSIPEFAYELEPRVIKTGRFDAVECIIRMAIPTPAGVKTPIRARTLAIRSGAVLLQFSFTEPTAESNAEVYAAFERSIVLEARDASPRP